jgi:hypothetical protein
MPTATDIRYYWVGGDPADGHINGIPARDLMNRDYEALDEEQRKAVQESPLYQSARSRARTQPAEHEAPTHRRDEDKPPESAAKS